MSESPSLPLSDGDNLLLSFIGQKLIEDIVGVICETIFWSVYLVLFCFTVRIQLRRGLRTKATMTMFAVTCFLFASSTSLWIMDFLYHFTRLKQTLLYHSDLGLLDRLNASEDHLRLYGLPMEAFFLANMVIGDAVVIWRAWAIWKGSRLQVLVFIPMFLLLVSFIFAIIDLSCLGTQSFSVRSTIPEGSRLCQWGEPIAWAVSLLTNIVSTTLIAIKAWQYHQFLKSNSSHFRLRSKNQNILLLLVESGFIYCLFWLSQLILFFDIQDGSKTHLLENALGALGDQISGVYPTAIIILVNLQRSMADDVESDRTHRLQELSTIQFDADPIHASLKMPDFPPSTPPLESSVASRHIAERYQEGALSETDGLTLHGVHEGSN